MAQRIDKLYSLVSIPAFYSQLQSALGSKRARTRLVDDLVQPTPGTRVLDVGCGPASLFPFLPKVDYWGFDLNSKHIAAAKTKFGDHGHFAVGDASRIAIGDIGQFDLIIVFAILHHLSDDESRALFASLERLLKAGGRIVTMDNVWLPQQRLIARVLNGLDSGLNIRTPAQYESLLDGTPFAVETRLYYDLLRVPYDHFCMTLTRET